jgi:tetratricopeptide (TPR) repeat protein
MEDFKTMLTYDPDSFAPICNIAMCYFQLQELDEAQKYFKKGEQINPQDPRLLYNYARLLVLKKKEKQAKKKLTQALKVNPEYSKYAEEDELLKKFT